MSEQGLDVEQHISYPEREAPKNPFFTVLADGYFKEDQVIVNKLPEPQIPSYLYDHIEIDWQKRGEKADGKKLNQLVPVGINVSDGKLEIDVYPASFAAFQATRNDKIRSEFPEYVADIIGTNVVLETSDSKLLVIQRDPNAATKPNSMSIIGGYSDTEDVVEGGNWNPFKTIRREIYEETGVSNDNIQDLVAIGVAYNKSSNQPSVIFSAKTKLSAAEVTRLKGTDEEEKIDVRFVPNNPKAVESLILKYAISPSPSGLAGLALYGKEKFGSDWFDWINKRLTRRNDAYLKHISGERKTALEDDNSEERASNRLKEIEKRGVESFLKRTDKI